MLQEHLPSQRIKMGESGRLVIPTAYRKAMGIKPGDELVIRVEDGELRLFQQQQAVERLRDELKRLGAKNFSVDDFLAFRREDSGD